MSDRLQILFCGARARSEAVMNCLLAPSSSSAHGDVHPGWDGELHFLEDW